MKKNHIFEEYKNRLILLTITAIFVMTMPALAQPELKSEINKTKITIGDPIELQLSLSPENKDDQVEWPLFADMLGELEWIDIGKIDTIEEDNRLVYHQKMQITGFDSGTYFIPNFTFLVNGEPWTTDSFEIYVETILVDTTQSIMDIKDVYDPGFSIWDYWEIILGSILAIALIAYLIYYFKKRKKKEQPKQVPMEEAHIVALRLLSELESKKLWETGAVKDFYAELSIILRSYIENRFQVKALEQTTDELLAAAKKNRELKVVRKDLRAIMQFSDLVKFAKAEASVSEHESYLEQAKYIIHKTKIKHQEEGNK